MRNTILTLMILLLGVCAIGQPTSGKCGKNVTWTLQDSILIIEGQGDTYDYSKKPQNSPFVKNGIEDRIKVVDLTRFNSEIDPTKNNYRVVFNNLPSNNVVCNNDMYRIVLPKTSDKTHKVLGNLKELPKIELLTNIKDGKKSYGYNYNNNAYDFVYYNQIHDESKLIENGKKYKSQTWYD